MDRLSYRRHRFNDGCACGCYIQSETLTNRRAPAMPLWRRMSFGD
jgi:hypothetical protein